MTRKTRALTAAEQSRYDGLRKRAEKDFPPKQRQQFMSPPGIPTQIREARELQGLTWYAVAKAAGIPNSGTIRDIEAGRDAKLSNIEAIANVVGWKLAVFQYTGR